MDEPAKTQWSGGSRSGRKITRLPLTTLGGLIKEAGRVYRKMKAGKMPHEEGRSLIWSLSQIRPMLEAQQLEAIEQRLNALGESTRGRLIEHRPEELNGHQVAN